MKLKNIAVLVLAGLSFTAEASVCKNNPGSITCGKGSVAEAFADGAASFKETIVAGKAEVNGSLKAENTSFQSLEVNGAADLTQCTISQDAEINGGLQASYSKFERSLSCLLYTSRCV